MAMPPAFQLYRFLDEDGVWWRLVSPNGRGLARSIEASPTADDARDDLEQVVAHVAALEPVVRLTPEYRWRWSLRSDGEDVVRGIGDQDRRVRCVHACRNFVELAPLAHRDPAVAAFRRANGAPRAERAAT